MDQSYEWVPLYLRMSELLESPPIKTYLITWIESPAIGYDRSDLVEFGKDLWCILVNCTTPGSGPATMVNLVMETDAGWMRGPIALYEMQRESLGRTADRRAELNRKVHHPTAVRRWEDVPGALNQWETVANEYMAMTKHNLEEESEMNSLLRLLPKSLYELDVIQYGIFELQ